MNTLNRLISLFRWLKPRRSGMPSFEILLAANVRAYGRVVVEAENLEEAEQRMIELCKTGIDAVFGAHPYLVFNVAYDTIDYPEVIIEPVEIPNDK